jgi:hypothetical protein
LDNLPSFIIGLLLMPIFFNHVLSPCSPSLWTSPVGRNPHARRIQLQEFQRVWTRPLEL